MSYSILIKTKASVISEIPFATRHAYKTFWKPILETHQEFTILPVFEYSKSLTQEEFEKLKSELITIKGLFNDKKIEERIDFLTKELAKINFSKLDDFFIG